MRVRELLDKINAVIAERGSAVLEATVLVEGCDCTGVAVGIVYDPTAVDYYSEEPAPTLEVTRR